MSLLGIFHNFKVLSRGVPKILLSSTSTEPISSKFRQFNRSSKISSVFEPEYLDVKQTEIPFHELLNVQIKGYDFPVLEQYEKYLHRMANKLGIDVEETWAYPCQKLKITRLKQESNVTHSEYLLNIYERNVQLSEVPTNLLSIYIDIVKSAIPSGVTLRIHRHIPEYTEIRYVPDLELKELKEQLDTIVEEKNK